MNSCSASSAKDSSGRSALWWLARLSSLAGLALMAVWAYQQRMNPLQMSEDSLILFLCCPGVVALGLLVGWRWDLAGGILAISGWVGFQVAHRFLVGSFSTEWQAAAVVVPALLSVVSGWQAARKRGQTTPAEGGPP